MSTEPRAITLTLSGDLNVASRRGLERKLNPARDYDVAIIDMSAVRYIDSSAIGALVELRHDMIGGGRRGHLRLVGVAPQLQRVFKICSLDRVFELRERSS
jgi:anti-anti-sigma factor